MILWPVWVRLWPAALVLVIWAVIDAASHPAWRDRTLCATGMAPAGRASFADQAWQLAAAQAPMWSDAAFNDASSAWMPCMSVPSLAGSDLSLVRMVTNFA